MKWRISAACVGAVALWCGAAGAAEPERRLLVGELDGVVDAAQMREAVSAELGAEVVGPQDARAAEAEGTVRVAVDEGSRQLTVSFRRVNAPLVRSVPLPAAGGARLRAVRALVGNLARDEAGRVMATLGDGEKEPAASKVPDTTETDRARLGRLLTSYADEDRHARHVGGGTLLGLGAAVGAGGVVLAVSGSGDDASADRRRERYGLSLVGAGAGLFGVGLLTLLSSTPHEDLARLASSGGETVEELEGRWKRAAASARSSRHVYGGLLLGLGGAFVAGGLLAPALVDDAKPYDGVPFAVPGALLMGMGVLSFAAESPVETSWRAHQISEGRPAATGVQVSLAPTKGGAMAGVGFTW